MMCKCSDSLRRRKIRSHEQGMALLTVMMILVLVATLGMSAMETTMRDNQVAGVQIRSRVAFQAAEAKCAC